MAANLVEKLQEAIKACEEISANDFKTQKDEIAKKFGEFQKKVYEIIDEKGIILSTFEWKQKKVCTNKLHDWEDVVDSEAERISMHTGYSVDTIKELLVIENSFKFKVNSFFGGYEYIFYTIDY